ncbi:MAG: DUF885 family protein [Erysipelotrichia bacterium]|nr:DUF885 family protein [Erysipelotrichia bacterium]
MKKIISLLLILTLLVTFTGCKKNDTSESEKFAQLTKQWFVEDMSQDYLTTHFALVDMSKYGIEKPEVTLGEIENDEEDTTYKDRLAQLEKIKASKLSAQDQLTYETLTDYYQLQQEMLDFEYDYGFLFTPNSGVNNNLITNFTEFALRNEEDARDFITLVRDSGRYMDLCIDYTKQQAQQEIIQSDATIDGILEQCRRFIANVEDNEVIKAYNTSINKLNLTNSQDYKEELAQAVKEILIPAYERVIAMYEELKGKSVNQDGLYYYDGGKEYYAEMFKYRASSSQSVEKAEKALEKEIDRLVRKIVRQQVKLNDEEQNAFENADYGYSDPYEMLDYLKKAMQQDFPQIPQVNYTVDYLDPSVTSDNVVAYYLIASIDNLTDNIIKCNQSYCKDDPSYLCITLSHEGYPGHLYQHTYYFTNNPDQLIRYNLDYSGFTEGWAMYVEDYAYGYFEKSAEVRELNIYYNRFNYYLEAYCDILINYEGYRQDDISNYLQNFFTREYADELAESLYSTLVSDPLMFVPYALGYYHMTELYDKAENKLGEKFNV